MARPTAHCYVEPQNRMRLRMKSAGSVVSILAALSSAAVVRADWPELHGNPRHDGFVSAEVNAPFRLAWVRHFTGERLGTAMEPVVASGKVFVATHSGNVYALDAASGDARWRFAAHGAFLHSPAVAGGSLVAGCADGRLYVLELETGRMKKSYECGSLSASPTVAEGRAFIGDRSGLFFAMDLKSARNVWSQSLKVPIRQTAAVDGNRVFVMAEDLRVRCFDAANGTLMWTSEQLAGQTARDYYPVVVRAGERTWVIVRTNPIINMGQRIARDRHWLAENAGMDDSDWRKVDAWTKSEQAAGNPELWEKEQKSIVRYLDEHRDARSFFVLDAETGNEATSPPVLWIAGCQGVGVMPALTGDGRLLVFYRSAYGNWSHGVAPLVALGLLDLTQNRIIPLSHQFGVKPAWNTFWGTSDESQNFVVAGRTALIVHQGTLSGFDLKENKLFAMWGERDTYGGFRNPPWARNEWHGPARGGVAVVDNRIYWISGSRLLCLVAGEQGNPAKDIGLEAAEVPAQTARQPPLPGKELVKLNQAVEEILSSRWAPLFVDPGLAGREFFFDDSGEVFEALARVWPQVASGLRQRLTAFLATEWVQHPPFAREAWYSLQEGARREWFRVPDEVLSRLGQDKPHHPFGNVHAVWLYAERCGEWDRVLSAWPQIKSCFENFRKTGWTLDRVQGDIHANRYLASLIAFARIARRARDVDAANRAAAMETATSEDLVAWWNRAAARIATDVFKGAAELDPFINGGDAISFPIAPHRHKIALFHDLTPEVAALVRSRAPEAAAKIWQTFQTLYRTWDLAGEERQVHSGENFVDPPDLALDAFKAMAWLKGAPRDELARHVDLPLCRADLYYLTKLALTVEAPRVQAP